MVTLVDIQIAGSSAALKADEGFHGFRRLGPSPPFRRVQILRPGDPVHIEEGDGVGNLAAALRLVDLDVGQSFGKIHQLQIADIVKTDRIFVRILVCGGVDSGKSRVVLDDELTVVGQALIVLRHDDGGQSDVAAAVVDILGDQLPFQQFLVQDDQDIMGPEASGILCPGPHGLSQRVEHFTGLVFAGSVIPDLFVLGPHMGKPFDKLPGPGVGDLVGVVGQSDLHVGVAVVAGDLGDHTPDDLDPGIIAADDAYQALLPEVDANRHILHDAETLFDHTGLLRQRIVQHGEPLFLDFDIHGAGHVSQTQPVGQHVAVVKVPAPQLFIADIVLRDHLRGNVLFAEGSGVGLITFLYVILLIDQILAVFLETAPFLLIDPLFIEPKIGHCPEHADTGGSRGRDDAGVHQRVAGAAQTGGYDGHAASQKHGNGHGHGRSDLHEERDLSQLLWIGRRIDGDRLRIDLGDASGGPVKQGTGAASVLVSLCLQESQFRGGHFRQIRLASCRIVDCQEIVQIEHAQAEDPDIVSEVQFRPAVYPHVVDIGTVGRGVFQPGVCPVIGDAAVMMGDKAFGLGIRRIPVTDIVVRLDTYGDHLIGDQDVFSVDA